MNLNQVTVPVKNIEKSISFYKLLGLKLIVHSSDDYARFECPNGDSTFSISKTEKVKSDSGIHVYFECDNLDELVADLESLDIEFDLLPTDQKWLWKEARLKDPDGNHLILYRAGENRKNPPWRISN